MLFTDAILNDRAIKVFNHGNMSRDFTYIDDIIDGIIKVILNPSDFKVYNAPVSLMEFIQTIEKAIGKVATKNFLPMQDGDVDVSGLIEDFDYKPDIKLADGICEFVKWYREFYLIESASTKGKNK